MGRILDEASYNEKMRSARHQKLIDEMKNDRYAVQDAYANVYPTKNSNHIQQMHTRNTERRNMETMPGVTSEYQYVRFDNPKHVEVFLIPATDKNGWHHRLIFDKLHQSPIGFAIYDDKNRHIANSNFNSNARSINEMINTGGLDIIADSFDDNKLRYSVGLGMTYFKRVGIDPLNKADVMYFRQKYR